MEDYRFVSYVSCHGPCQPFKDDQTPLCSEFQSLVQDGVGIGIIVHHQRDKTNHSNLQTNPSSLSDSDKIYGYVMVATSCPSSWSNTKTAHACASTDYLADPLTALPVFDKRTNLTYANIYCAMCHGRTRRLRLWSIRIKKNNCSLQCNNPLDTLWKLSHFKMELRIDASSHHRKLTQSLARI
ncbi:hypothetical protein OS493_003611 [Desmophyllum pertusum]|uniref:Uncharacterized protein n=1 Tax=Desmophyllum pertusum TaxID=174260 RepID=A0A9X0DB13_9CNID|nr:hypothetical protein OS493_003611 [Desmophyllum pertusum]